MKLAARIAAIEFVGDEVRLAVIKTSGKLPRVLELHCGQATYDDPEKRKEALIEAVQDVVGRMESTPAAYVLCLSSFHSVVRSLTIPFKGRRRVAGAVRFELERYLAFPIEELIVDFFPVLEVEGQTEVLALGVRREVLCEQLEILSAAGVEAEGANVDAVGLTGLWRDSRRDLKGLHAVLHAREVGSILAVVNGKSPVYFRHLAFTADELHSEPEAAAQQVQNSVRAFHAGWKAEGRVASLTVTGEGFTEEAQERFARGFDVPVTYEDMLTMLGGANQVLDNLEREQVRAGAEYRRPCNGWEAAIGTADCAGGGAISLNFRKDDLAPKNVLAKLIPTVMLSSCLALLLLVSVAWYFKHQDARARSEVSRIEDEVAALQQEVEQLQGQGISVAAEVFSQPTLLDILDEIALRVPDNKASITRLTVEPPGSSLPWIQIWGVGSDDVASTEVLSSLRQTAMFQVDEPDLTLEEGKTTFKVKAYRNDPAVSAGSE